MGKTHLSGLEIGDVGIDIWASPSLNQKVRFAALNTSQRLHFPEGAHITMLRVADGTGALVVATVKVGKTAGAQDIFTGSSTAGAALSVEKYAPPGFAYVELSAGPPPATPVWVIISYIAALNA